MYPTLVWLANTRLQLQPTPAASENWVCFPEQQQSAVPGCLSLAGLLPVQSRTTALFFQGCRSIRDCSVLHLGGGCELAAPSYPRWTHSRHRDSFKKWVRAPGGVVKVYKLLCPSKLFSALKKGKLRPWLLPRRLCLAARRTGRPLPPRDKRLTLPSR